MDELLRTVTEKTGLPADKAQDAITAVIDFLKDKLPGPIGDQVAGLVGGEGGGVGDMVGDVGDKLGGATDKLGGMFGK